MNPLRVRGREMMAGDLRLVTDLAPSPDKPKSARLFHLSELLGTCVKHSDGWVFESSVWCKPSVAEQIAQEQFIGLSDWSALVGWLLDVNAMLGGRLDVTSY